MPQSQTIRTKRKNKRTGSAFKRARNSYRKNDNRSSKTASQWKKQTMRRINLELKTRKMMRQSSNRKSKARRPSNEIKLRTTSPIQWWPTSASRSSQNKARSLSVTRRRARTRSTWRALWCTMAQQSTTRLTRIKVKRMMSIRRTIMRNSQTQMLRMMNNR